MDLAFIRTFRGNFHPINLGFLSLAPEKKNMDNYFTKRFRAVDNDNRILRSIFCAHCHIPTGQASTERPPTNYWVCFLELTTLGSVKIDMIPGGGADYLGGVIMLESNPCQNQQHRQRHGVRIPTVADGSNHHERNCSVEERLLSVYG
jgi:hypothetical protein